MERPGLLEVLFSCSSDLVWAPGKLVPGETGEVRFSHSVGQWRLGLVWAPSALSGGARLSLSVGRVHPVLAGVLVLGYQGLVWAQELVV